MRLDFKNVNLYELNHFIRMYLKVTEILNKYKIRKTDWKLSHDFP